MKLTLNSSIRFCAAGSIAVAFAATAHGATVIGVNFARDGGGATTGVADGLSAWTDVYDNPDGFAGTQNKVVTGSSSAVTASWIASGSYYAGSNGSSEQRIYACYLDDGLTSNYTLGGSSGDGIGIRLQIKGLSAWLASEGMTSYQIRTYASTDNGIGFQTITVHSGDAAGAVLGTSSPQILGDGNFPDSTGGGGIRGYADVAGSFSDDIVTVTVPFRNGGTTRGTLAAIKITAVPEPSVALMGGFGLLGLLRRRRR